MIAPNPIFGTGLHALGGVSAASCYLPYQKTKWSWGSFWIVQAHFAWVIVPILIALLTVPDLMSCFTGAPASAIFIPMLLGAIYGFGVGLELAQPESGTKPSGSFILKMHFQREAIQRIFSGRPWVEPCGMYSSFSMDWDMSAWAISWQPAG